MGGTGSIYTFYGPEEPLFKSLTDNFLKKAGDSTPPLNGGVSKKYCSGTPKKINFNRGFHYKPSILGYQYFWNHPYMRENLASV